MVDKIGRCPGDAIVAALARVACVDVRQAFACNLRIIVTANAVIGDASVIERRRNPRVRGMTIIAGITARKMRRMFAGSGCAVMTGEAGTDDLGVIDRVGRDPDDIDVAILADIGGVDMSQVIPECDRAVQAL